MSRPHAFGEPIVSQGSRIDVYVDGCALLPSKANSCGVTGWGGVIVVSHNGEAQEPVLFSGAQGNDSTTSTIAEIHAILEGLKKADEVQATMEGKAAIIIHTDQQNLSASFNPLLVRMHQHDGKKEKITFTPPKYAEEDFAHIQELQQRLHASIHYEPSGKNKHPHPVRKVYMDHADRLASVSAYNERHRLQGGVSTIMGREFTRADLERYYPELKDSHVVPHL